MAPEHVAGPGRDRRFDLPQYFLVLDGIRTAFFDSGGPGPVLLFIHGMAGNGTHWVHVAPRFASRYRVVGIDLPGCGESETPEGRLSVRGYARHVLSLMNALGIESATLIGHSLGGMVSTDFGLHYADRTDRLVLVNPAGFQSVSGAGRILGRLVLREPFLNRVLPKRWRWVLGRTFAVDNENTRAFIRTVDETYCHDDIYAISHMIASMREDLLDKNYAAILPQLHVPVYLIWGSEDRLVPARDLWRAASHLGEIHVEEIPGAGHMPIIEDPARVNAFIERALRE